MAGEPEYIKGLKREMQAVTQSMNGTEKAIVRIDTTLAENLPAMKAQLSQLNGTVRRHDTDIALQRQAHEDCPARKAEKNPNEKNPGGNLIIDLGDRRTKAVVGGVVGAPTLLLALDIILTAARHFWGG